MLYSPSALLLHQAVKYLLKNWQGLQLWHACCLVWLLFFFKLLDLEGRQEVQESTGGRQQLREPSAPGKGCCDACSLSAPYDHPLTTH